MLTREENDLLCRVEGDAPMGQMMRRYWTPVCLIEEGLPKPMARRSRRRCSAKIQWCSATPMAASG